MDSPQVKAWHSVVFRRDAARPSASARITGSSYRLVQGLFWVIALSVAYTGNAVFGQTQTQIQYTYDAAGNVIQVTRSTVVPQPDLTVSNLTIGTIAGNTNGSYNIPVMFQVNNIGNAVATATWYDRGYLSANTVLHDTDQALGGYNTHSTNLAVGASYAVSVTFTTTTTTTAGNYTLIVKADGGASTSGQYSPTGANYVAESDETNNTRAIAITLPVAQPDLALSNATVGTITVNQNGSYAIPVSFTVTNVGGTAATGGWYDMGYLSTDATLDNGDVNFGYAYRSAGLAAGGSYNVSTTFTTGTTTAPGNYTLIFKTDGRGAISGGTNTDNGAVAEINEANNTQAVNIALPTRPDLTFSNASVGAITVNQNGSYSMPVSFTVTNVGATPAAGSWYDMGYLSTDATLDNADVNFGYAYHSGGLAAGASYNASTTFTTSTTTVPGNYTLILKTDGHGSISGGTNTDNGAVAEINEANNTQALNITLPTRPDLTLSNASVGAIAVNQNGSYSMPVTFTVTNVGATPAAGSWYDMGYLSTDATLDNSDVNFGYAYRSGGLAAGTSYNVSTTFTTATTTAPGNYTLILKTDGHGSISGGTNADNGALVEADESNNTQTVSISLPGKPDLTASNISVGTIVKNANHSYIIAVTFTITNVGATPAQPNWYDLAYLSADRLLDNSDQNLSGYNYRNTVLAAGASYTVTTNFTTTTTTVAGSYTLFVKADGHGPTVTGGTNTDSGAMAEASETNNLVSTTVVLP